MQCASSKVDFKVTGIKNVIPRYTHSIINKAYYGRSGPVLLVGPNLEGDTRCSGRVLAGDYLGVGY
jgi:hypothetical protein